MAPAAGIIVGLVAAACSHAPLARPAAQGPAVQDHRTARLVVVREASPAGQASPPGPIGRYTVKVDDADVLAIGPGEYAMLPVEAGRHVVSVKCFVGGSPTWTEEQSIVVTTTEEVATHVAAVPSETCVAVRTVNEAEGRRLMEGATRLTPLDAKP